MRYVEPEPMHRQHVVAALMPILMHVNVAPDEVTELRVDGDGITLHVVGENPHQQVREVDDDGVRGRIVIPIEGGPL